ncbi:hypothetical protein AAVH_16547 [Aphelenchoides avenae]|nr:hypothetical protein AAVH_16547 [Aphelenchus avenae]
MHLRSSYIAYTLPSRGYDKQLGGLKPHVELVNGHFQVGGSMTDNIPTNHPEPYLLVKGVCPVEKNNGVVGRWHFEEKYGLPCNWQCNEHVLQAGGLVIILDGVRERPTC